MAIWVVAEDLHGGAAEKIQYGRLTKSDNDGLPLQSPNLAFLNKQAQTMVKAGAEPGFSPAICTKVQVASERASPLAWLRNHDDADDLIAEPWNFNGRPRQVRRTSSSTT
jgi:hypothetical protein